MFTLMLNICRKPIRLSKNTTAIDRGHYVVSIFVYNHYFGHSPWALRQICSPNDFRQEKRRFSDLVLINYCLKCPFFVRLLPNIHAS